MKYQATTARVECMYTWIYYKVPPSQIMFNLPVD